MHSGLQVNPQVEAATRILPSCPQNVELLAEKLVMQFDYEDKVRIQACVTAACLGCVNNTAAQPAPLPGEHNPLLLLTQDLLAAHLSQLLALSADKETLTGQLAAAIELVGFAV